MQRNNTYQALPILEAAYRELGKLNYDSSTQWGQQIKEAMEHFQFAIDEIVDNQHANNSIIHVENQF